MATAEQQTREKTAVHGGRLVARTLASRGGQPPLHALRRPPVLDLRRLQGGGDRGRRRPPRAVGGVRGRGVCEGHAQGGCLRADRRARGDQRDERDRRRPRQRLAALRARRTGAGDALGLGLAAGDRPPAFRQPAGQVGRDGQGLGPDPRADRRRSRPRSRAAERPDLRRLSARRRLHGGRGRGAGAASPEAGRAGRRGRRGRGAARRRRAAGDHGRHRRLLGARRAGAAGARRGARLPGVPERDGARMRPRRPRARLQPRPRRRAEGRGRGAGRRGAARLPARLRRLLRR